MSFSFKAARNFVTTCAAAVTLGAALAPSNALAVTTWNWSFSTNIPSQFGSGTFTTADVVPTAGTTYQITGASGTYNRGGTTYNITNLNTTYGFENKFRWNGTSSSPISTDYYKYIGMDTSAGNYVGFFNSTTLGFNPITLSASGFVGTDGTITTSSLAPYSPPSTAVPGPLPLLGAAAAFQASRRLRRRLNGSLPDA